MTTNHKEQIIRAALALAAKPGGWQTLTREAVALRAKCSAGLVSQHFGTMVAFKRDVMRHAILAKDLPIIAQGLAAGDRHALKAPEELRRAAAESLATA